MAVIVNANVADVARQLCIASRRKVVYCGSVGDAASPVWLVAGPHTKVIGQCADHQHNIEPHARPYGALVVEGWYDEARGWVCGCPGEFAGAVVSAISGATTTAALEAAEARRHAQMIANMDRLEAERPEREAREAVVSAAETARREELRPLFDAAIAKCRVKTNGQRHGGDVRAVEAAYRMAWTRNYDHDLAHWRRVLARLAEEGPAEAIVLAASV